MKKRNKQTQIKKEGRAMKRELWSLYRAKHNLGYVKLEKPIRDGWYKHLRLRDDIARGKDAAVFLEILKMCGLKIRNRSKPRLEEVWAKVLSKRKNVVHPGLRRLRQGDFERLSARAQKWFVAIGWYWTPKRGFEKRYYCKVPPYYFLVTYSKAYITERKIIDPTLESRICYLENKFQRAEFIKYRWDGSGHRYWGLTPAKRLRKKSRRLLANYDEDEYLYQMHSLY